MHSHSKGFTLIELMIAIAIIGILAAIAVPTYNTYVYKARVSELVSRAAPLQSAVAEFVGTTGAQDLATLPLANFAQFEIGPCTGTTAATTGPSGNIQNLCIQSNGSITVVGTANTAPGTPAKIGLIPTLNADGSLIWACRSCDANTAKYAAANCSEQATCTGP